MSKKPILILGLFLALLIAIPFSSAQVLYYSNFTGEFDAPQNGTVGTITPYLGGVGIVNQTGGNLVVNDQNGSDIGWRIQFDADTTDSVWIHLNMSLAQINGFHGMGISNCTVQSGLTTIDTCPDAASQEAWDADTVVWNTDFIKLYGLTTNCSYAINTFYDFRILHNQTNDTASVWRDGAFCGTKIVTAGQEIEVSRGAWMQSGGIQTGVYTTGDMCIYPASLGNITFDCGAFLYPPVVVSGYVPTHVVSDLPLITVDFIGEYLLQFVALAAVLALLVIWIWARKRGMLIGAGGMKGL